MKNVTAHELSDQERYDVLNVELLNDWILLDVIKEEVRDGRVILPDNSPDTMKRLRVVKCGPGRTYVTKEGHLDILPMPVKVGEVIYSHAEMQPKPVRFHGHTYLMLPASAVTVKETTPSA